MVVISHAVILALRAYSTGPLTPERERTVQHGFYNGTYARFSDPHATITMHERPEFHHRSHYGIRIFHDSEGMDDAFVVIDERTPELNAVWFVEPTWYSQDHEEVEEPGDVILYPDEKFTLWHGHIRTADVPLKTVLWADGCSDITEALDNNNYHPQDPQARLIDTHIDWTDPEVAGSAWGNAYLTAISGVEVAE